MFQGQELATLSMQVQKLPNVEIFGLETFHFWQLQGFASFGKFYYQTLMNAQHFISDSLTMLPKMATSVIHS